MTGSPDAFTDSAPYQGNRKVFTGEKTALTIHRIGTVALEPSDFSHNVMYCMYLGWKKKSDICSSTCWREALGIRVSSFGLYCEGFQDREGDQKREEVRASLQPCNERS